MSILQENIDFVKDQIRRTAAIYNKNPYHNSKLPEVIGKFQKLEAFLESAELQDSPKPKMRQEQLIVPPKDMIELPEELIAQLTQSKSDRAELNIIKAMEDVGGIISIDVLLVKLYKQNGEINDRRQLSTKLFRMAKKGLIFSVPGKKSVYSLEPLEAERDVESEEQ